MSKKTISLVWQGPLQSGNFPVTEKQIGDLGLENPGVYVILMTYPNFWTGYAGQTSNLRQRLKEHLSNYLGLAYALRREKPAFNLERKDQSKWKNEYLCWRVKEEGLGWFNEPLRHIPAALLEIKRLQFFYCAYPKDVEGECDLTSADFVKWMEAHLILHLKSQQGEKNKFICDNERHSRYNFQESRLRDFLLKNQYSEKRQQKVLKRILGDSLKSPFETDRSPL